MLSTFCFAVPESLNNDAEIISEITDRSESLRSSERFHSRNKKRKSSKVSSKLRLKDFSGNFIFNTVSVGGLAGQVTFGASQIVTGHISFDKKGKGQINIASFIDYFGEPGQVELVTIPGGVTTLEITILDPILGSISMHVSSEVLGIDETYFAMTIKSLETGQVLKIEGQRIKVVHEPLTNLFTFVAERQFQHQN